MKRQTLVGIIFAFSMAATASALPTAPSLEQAYSGAVQAVAPSAAALRQQVQDRAARTATAKTAAAKERKFYLEFADSGWRLMPDPNPGWGLDLAVDVGDHVHLTLVNDCIGHDAPDAVFEVDDIDAVVAGKPSRGIYVWLRSRGESV